MTPDLRRLHHFVAVAETGSFTAAAQSLHLSQQALSSSIRQLEREMGASLFTREGRRISLTRAGEVLLAEGRPLLAAASTVAQRVGASTGEANELYTIGHTPAISNSEAYLLVEAAIDAFPDVSFTLRQMFPDQLSEAVRDGSVQLGLRRGVITPSDLDGMVVHYHRVRIAVTTEHRLARRRKISIADLASERIALWAPPGSSYYTDFLLSACRRAGFEPAYVVSRVQGAPTVAAPLTTGGVTFVTTAAGPAMNGRVQVIELEPRLLVPVQAFWQRHTVSAVRDVLLAAARS